MKATGWHTLEVLELISFEQLLISLLGATIAIVLSILWVKGFNGAFIAQFFYCRDNHVAQIYSPCTVSPLTVPPEFFLCLSLDYGW